MKSPIVNLSSLCLAVAGLALPVAAAAEPVVAAYYSPAGGGQAALKRPSAQKLTHLIYAFVPVCGDSAAFDAEEAKARKPICTGVADYALALPDTAEMRAELKAMAELKQRNPDLKIVASVGGWGMPMFPEVVARPERRQVFTDSAVAFLKRYPVFDGLDIDWEYPGGGDEARALLTDQARKQEAADHRALIEGLRRAFDALEARDGRERLLTTAVAGYPRSVAGIDWKGVEDDVDLVFVMTYDFTPEKAFQRNGDYSGGGGWPGHHTNLVAGPSTDGYGADAIIGNLAAAGVPKHKMVLGAGFYAREWTKARFDEGRFPASGSGGEVAGMPSWTEVQARNLQEKGWSAGYDEVAKAAYLHDSASGGFLSLDTPRSLSDKGDYVRREGLAGLFGWELTQDDGTLVEAMATAATGADPALRLESLPVPLRAVNAPNIETSGRTLRLTAFKGADMFTPTSGASAVLTAPRVLFPVSGDFILSARVSAPFRADYDGAALVIWSNEKRWGKLLFERISPTATVVSTSFAIDGSDNSYHVTLPADATSLWLKMVRTDDVVRLYFSNDGDKWQILRDLRFEAPAADLSAGFMAQSPVASALTAQFTDIRFEARTARDYWQGE